MRSIGFTSCHVVSRPIKNGSVNFGRALLPAPSSGSRPGVTRSALSAPYCDLTGDIPSRHADNRPRKTGRVIEEAVILSGNRKHASGLAIRQSVLACGLCSTCVREGGVIGTDIRGGVLNDTGRVVHTSTAARCRAVPRATRLTRPTNAAGPTTAI